MYCFKLHVHPFLFQGDIQSLLLIPDPEAAFETCNYYTPDCQENFLRDNNTLFYNTSIGRVSD